MSEEIRGSAKLKQAAAWHREDGVEYQRIPVKTHLITKADKMEDVVLQYAKDKMQAGDILFISEKAVACTQNRAIPMEDIKPRKLAVTLSRYMTKTPAGIGLGIPETMEMALQECGTLRILFAAFCSVIGKILGRKGWFYIVAGPGRPGHRRPHRGDHPALRPLRGPHPRRPHGYLQEAGPGPSHLGGYRGTSTTWGPTFWASPEKEPMGPDRQDPGDNPGPVQRVHFMGIIRKA